MQETRSSDAAGTQVVGASSYAYGPTGQVSAIQHTDGAGEVIGDYTSSYDAAGELTGGTDNGTGLYDQYDATGQLTQSGMSWYAYDANGNRSNQGYVIGPDNQVLSDGLWVYSYDGEGNEVAKVNLQTGDTWHYAFDARNQLVTAEEDAGSGGSVLVHVDYKYDVFGNRIEKDVLLVGASVPVVTRYAYDGWNPAKGTPVGTENFDVWAELDGNGSLTTRYLRGDVVDQIFARVGQDGTAAWLDTDRLGSVRAVTDGNGVLLDQIAYDSFGNSTSESNPVAGGVYKWTGREFDTETGLQYNRARYYDGATGRWLSQDPLGFSAGDSNLYRYAQNAPTKATDPSGLADRIYELARKKWTVEGVSELLRLTALGKLTLYTLSKPGIKVYRVDKIVREYMERPDKNSDWPKEWKKQYLLGLHFPPRGNLPRRVYLLDGDTNIEAALTLVHEATHARQKALDPKTLARLTPKAVVALKQLKIEDDEYEAHVNEARLLALMPYLKPLAPVIRRKWIKYEKGKFLVKLEPISKHVTKVYGPIIRSEQAEGEDTFRWKVDKTNTIIYDWGQIKEVTGWKK